MSGPALSAANEALYRDYQRARNRPELARIRYALASLDRHAGGAPLTGLTRADILDWVSTLEDMTPSSRLTYFSSVRAFYNWAASPAEAIIERSPMAGMREPANPRRPVPIPADDDVRQLIAETEKDRTPIGRRDAAMLRVLFDTGGPRASEAAGMLIAGRPHPQGTPPGLGADLARAAATITVIGKGGRIRTWPVANKTATAISRWVRVRDTLPRAQASARLWLTFRGTGKPLTYSGVEDVLERRCKAAGVARMHPHQARHFSYHHFLKRGGRLNDAKLLYGWDDNEMPQRYAAALAAERAVEAGTILAIGDQW